MTGSLQGVTGVRKADAIGLLSSGNFQRALDIAVEVCRDDPADGEARWLQGVCLVKLDRPVEALLCLHQALFLSPNNRQILLQIATVSEYAGRIDDAIAAYCGVLSLSPAGDRFCLYAVACLLLKRLEAACAEVEIGRVLALAHRLLGLVEQDWVESERRVWVGYRVVSILRGAFGPADKGWVEAIRAEALRLGAGAVLVGPYRGMVLPPGFTAACDPLSVFGLADYQLESVINHWVGNEYDTLLIAGAGLGYHAVGLARLLPQARVIAWESDGARRAVCRELAAANQIGDRLQLVDGPVETAALVAAAQTGRRALCMVNIGGGELELLDEAAIAAMGRTDMIVECHDYLGFDVAGVLAHQFIETHGTEIMMRRAADAWKIAPLQGLDPILRWRAVVDLASTSNVLAYDKKWICASVSCV